MPMGDKEPLFVRDERSRNGYVLNHRNPSGLALIVVLTVGVLILAVVALG
ncbi:hypothetical protein [Streptomyces reniochalinae]|nr:hypothetical protein [Streptomyces reniochalinae]